MIREAEVKKAFRVVYEALDKCPDPVNNSEYFDKILRRFLEVDEENRGNKLVRRLLIGCYEWLTDIAKEKEKSN